MKLFVYPNLMSLSQIQTTKKAIDVLVNSLHHEVSMSKEDSYKFSGNEEFFHFSVEECDVIVALGGDACVLKTAQSAYKFNKPLLGINAGHIGYLCAVQKDEISYLTDEKINSLKRNELDVLYLLYKDNIYYAFNDVVIGKHNFGKVIDIDFQINNDPSISYRGDGLIIATPLGSTGYSYSAGGNSLKIDADEFAITPICPHFRRVEPKSIKNNAVISINSHFSYENRTDVFVDGNYLGELKGMISIARSKKSLILLKD